MSERPLGPFDDALNSWFTFAAQAKMDVDKIRARLRQAEGLLHDFPLRKRFDNSPLPHITAARDFLKEHPHA